MHIVKGINIRAFGNCHKYINPVSLVGKNKTKLQIASTAVGKINLTRICCKIGWNPCEDGTKHNVLDKSFFPWKKEDIENNSGEIISGANFPKVMFIVF